MATALERNNDVAADVYRAKRSDEINTTLAAAISSTGNQTATTASESNIAVGRTVTVDAGANAEDVEVLTHPTPTTFTAVFTRTHLTGVTVYDEGTGVWLPPDLENDTPVNGNTPVWIDVIPEPPVSRIHWNSYLEELRVGRREYRYVELPLSFLNFARGREIVTGWQIVFDDGLDGTAPDGGHQLSIVRLPRSESQRLLIGCDCVEEEGLGL
jgi:hypothetical protein